MTRYVFIGAGAIGSGIGGLLAQQGTDVVLVARGDHATVTARDGLTVRMPDQKFTLAVPTVTGPDQLRLDAGDILVLTTKSHQAEAAINQWADAPVYDGDQVLGRAADLLPIFTALNGVASESIALRYFERVYAVCVWMPAVMIAPGEVIVRTVPARGIFHMGRFPHAAATSADAELLAQVRADWDPAGCKVQLPAAVMDWKYRKLISNLGNALQALLGSGTDRRDISALIDAEARLVLDKSGIPYISDADEAAARQNTFQMRPVPGEPAELGGSSWQSLARGTGTIETDFLNGEISYLARQYGLSAPINTRLTALARRAAVEGWRPGSLTTAELRTALGI